MIVAGIRKMTIRKDKIAVKSINRTSSKGMIEKDKTAMNCPNAPSVDQSFNFAINNELRECIEFRLEHLKVSKRAENTKN